VTAIDRWMKLGADGFCVSIVYGPCGNNGPKFSVDVLSLDGQSFDHPFAASSFDHAVEIAEIEIGKHGWNKQ
jgi:hypothetical protein